MKTQVLDLASEAGHILLENGAEIARVEEVMQRISHHYGAEDANFFVLSNGIFTTGENYSRTEHIPIKGTQLEKVIAVNQLSRDLPRENYSIEEFKERLDKIKAAPSQKTLPKLIGAAFGCAGFCAIFGGSLSDCLACLISGFLLNIFVIFIGSHLTKALSNICAGALGTAICILFQSLGLGENIGNMTVGTMILLIPGVAFTNGLRDIANEDYIAGSTRLLDALLVFFCIATGVCISFFVHGTAAGGVIELNGTVTDPFTGQFWFQTLAAFIGTAFFAILFGVPKKYCVPSGLVGMAGWIIFLSITKFTSLGIIAGTLCAATGVAILSRKVAVSLRCPSTVFLICGIFPLIPGGGVFWSAYYIVSYHLMDALSSGFTAIKLTAAIVVGIIISFNVFHRR